MIRGSFKGPGPPDQVPTNENLIFGLSEKSHKKSFFSVVAVIYSSVFFSQYHLNKDKHGSAAPEGVAHACCHGRMKFVQKMKNNFLWTSCGFPLDLIWISNGFPVEFIWSFLGRPFSATKRWFPDRAMQREQKKIIPGSNNCHIARSLSTKASERSKDATRAKKNNFIARSLSTKASERSSDPTYIANLINFLMVLRKMIRVPYIFCRF